MTQYIYVFFNHILNFPVAKIYQLKKNSEIVKGHLYTAFENAQC